MVREVATARPQAIVTLCTNLAAAPIVPALEEELDLPIFDSIAVVVWKALKVAGVDPLLLKSWGRLFQQQLGINPPTAEPSVRSSPALLL
jgi:maleate isomerase